MTNEEEGDGVRARKKSANNNEQKRKNVKRDGGRETCAVQL